MLAADRQLLDAHLRNELQQLRRLEITNVVNRFQSALTPATLIAGFSMVGISALDFTAQLGLGDTSHASEPIFYLCTAVALATSLYVTAVSTVGIVRAARRKYFRIAAFFGGLTACSSVRLDGRFSASASRYRRRRRRATTTTRLCRSSTPNSSMCAAARTLPAGGRVRGGRRGWYPYPQGAL